MLTSRILPIEEWARLDALPLGALRQHFVPADTQVIVVEQDGEIVGHWAVFRVTHVEGVWIAPPYRGRVRVITRLLREMRAAAARWGAPRVMTAAMDENIRHLLVHLGAQQLPGDHFVLEVGGL